MTNVIAGRELGLFSHEPAEESAPARGVVATRERSSNGCRGRARSDTGTPVAFDEPSTCSIEGERVGRPMASAKTNRRLGLLASLVAVGAALLWLAFFVEHVADWFAGPPMPPPIVWAAQLAHLAILLGLLASLRWRLTGSIVTVASAVLFFALTVWPPVPVLFIPTVAPALLFLLAWMLGRNANAERLRA